MNRLFPYSPRKGQTEMVEALVGNIEKSKHSAVQAGTGTGKTICALTAALGSCADDNRRVLYLTRTNSQQRQVLLELRAISGISRIFGMAIQGRRNMCPHVAMSEELRNGSYEELSLLCSQKKSMVMNGNPNGCRFFHTLMSVDCSGIETWARNNLPTAEEFVGRCTEFGICAYEMCKRLVAEAKVVTAPYIYFFDPLIRKNLLEWMGCELQDLIVIVDEAHNLPEYARELKTAELTMNTLRAAEREARELKDPELLEGTSTSDFLGMLREILEKSIAEFVLDDDGLVPMGLLEEELMTRLKVTSRGLLRISENLVTLGEIIRDRKKKEGRLPRSYLHSIGNFLEFWMSVDEEEYVKLVVGGESARFEAYCLDPSLACACISKASSSIHMSGTLEPLDEYRDSIGLPEDSPMLSFPSPFPKDNLLLLYADDVTSRYEDLAKDERILAKMREYIIGIARGFDRNIAAFFPSYALLERFVEDGLTNDIPCRVFKEEKGMQQENLMSIVTDFKKCENGGLMLAVSGGRISEGIDFPDRELEIAIIVGIPYPKPSARTRALQHYYELKFGKGWDYVMKAPATRKMLQSIGRLIRSETDIGAALILDRRVIHFKPHITAVPTRRPTENMREFFDKRKKSGKIRLSRRKSVRPRTEFGRNGND